MRMRRGEDGCEKGNSGNVSHVLNAFNGTTEGCTLKRLLSAHSVKPRAGKAMCRLRVRFAKLMIVVWAQLTHVMIIIENDLRINPLTGRVEPPGV